MAQARDTITLTGLRGHGHHGVFAHEREAGQWFVVDVVLEVDTRAAAASDALADTVDYGTVADAVVAVVEGEPLDLVEALAGRIADRCLAERGVLGVTVTVHKPQAPIAVPFADVSVTITRSSGARGGS